MKVVYIQENDPEPECKETLEWLHWKSRKSLDETLRGGSKITYEESCNIPSPIEDAVKTFIEENPEHMDAAHKAWNTLSEEGILAFTKVAIREEDGSSL